MLSSEETVVIHQTKPSDILVFLLTSSSLPLCGLEQTYIPLRQDCVHFSNERGNFAFSLNTKDT